MFTAFFYGENLMSWHVGKQKVVSCSSTELGYCAMAFAAVELLWIRRLLGEIGFFVQYPSVIFCDNFSTKQLTNNPIFHTRVKYIEIDFHFMYD